MSLRAAGWSNRDEQLMCDRLAGCVVVAFWRKRDTLRAEAEAWSAFGGDLCVCSAVEWERQCWLGQVVFGVEGHDCGADGEEFDHV